jgi:hypothetical protein
MTVSISFFFTFFGNKFCSLFQVSSRATMDGKMQPPAGPGGRKRQNLTLDLNSASAAKRNKVQSLLTSPDVQMLKLTSPELEKFLSQNPSLATPTPSGYPFPRSVTEEQMMYAKGFEEALEHLRNAEMTTTSGTDILDAAAGLASTTAAAAAQLSEASMVAAATTLACLSSAAVNHSQYHHHQHQQLNSAAAAGLPHLPENLSVTASHPPASSAAHLPLSVPGAANLHIHIPDPHSRPNSGASGSYDSESVNIKDEPDDQSLSGGEYSSMTSPDGGGGGPNVHPIDMDDQERIKLERKRMRNRVAASKCRKRKLEKISLLDDRVQQLKTENADLAAVVKKMKASVALLKQEVIEHVNSGCEIRMTDSAASVS